MNNLDIRPGDLIEVKFMLENKPGNLIESKSICHVDEVIFTADGEYILKTTYKEGPLKCNTMEINMNKAGQYVRKLQYDEFLGDFV